MTNESLTLEETKWHDGTDWPDPVANEPFASTDEIFAQAATLARGIPDGTRPDPQFEVIYDLDGTMPEVKADPPSPIPVVARVVRRRMRAMMGALASEEHTNGLDLVLDEEKITIEASHAGTQIIDQSTKDHDSRFLVDQPERDLKRLPRPANDEHLFLSDELMAGALGITERPSKKEPLSIDVKPIKEKTPTREDLVALAEAKSKAATTSFALGAAALSHELHRAPVRHQSNQAAVPKKGMFTRLSEKFHGKPKEVHDWQPGLIDRMRYSPRTKRVLGTIAVAGVLFAGVATATVKTISESDQATAQTVSSKLIETTHSPTTLKIQSVTETPSTTTTTVEDAPVPVAVAADDSTPEKPAELTTEQLTNLWNLAVIVDQIKTANLWADQKTIDMMVQEKLEASVAYANALHAS